MKPEGTLFDRQWRKESEVIPIARGEVDDMLRQREQLGLFGIRVDTPHYLGCWPGVVVLTLGLRRSGVLLGVLVFALPPRETSKRYGGTTWELARLWLDDGVPKNGETFFIGRAIRYVRRSHPAVQVLVSYADSSVGHDGTIYKAANWQFDGVTDEERKSPRFDYVDSTTGKRYSRRSHVPPSAVIQRVARTPKRRFVYRLAVPRAGAQK